MTESNATRVLGIGMVGVTAALRPKVRAKPDLVPDSLRSYLDEVPKADRWYPLDDYVALMRILASTIDPAAAKGDVYRAFGVIAAQRDVFGETPNVPAEQRPENIGVLGNAFSGVTGLASLVRRALHLRERYYSTGYYTVKRTAERAIEITLHDFPKSPELCAVSTGYLTHVFRTTQPGSWVERVSCRGQGDPDCRWHVRFGPKTDVQDLKLFD